MMKTIAKALLVLTVSPSFASDVPFSFRGVSLGDSGPQALGTATQQFAFAKFELVGGSLPTIVAGDAKGMEVETCPISAAHDLRFNCLKARFGARQSATGDKIRLINVTQSFNPGVAHQGFMDRIQATYGPPRASFEPTRASPASRTYLWGGKQTPQGAFSPSWAPHDDFLAIGGMFILLQIFSNGSEVTGYTLRIADAEALLQSSIDSMNRLREGTERAKQSNLDGVRF